MANPIHLPDGTYQLAPGEELIFDLGQDQDTVSITNDNQQGNGAFTLSINHSTPVQHNLAPGTSFNLTNQAPGTHYHILNNGQVTLEVDIA